MRNAESKRKMTFIQIASSKTLILVTSGSMSIGDNKIKKDNIVYISPYANYKFSAIESADVIEILFEYSDEHIPLFSESIRIFEAPMETIDCINRIYYNKLYINTISGVNEALLLNVLNMLNILSASYSAERGLYQKLCEWLEVSNYTTAEQAATAMSCTVAHLNRIVKKYSNKCLSTINSEKMIIKIKMLLKYSKYSTKEIAENLGFGSSELMRKFFKYHTVMSLNDYKYKSAII
ncbi:MAG: hypothetical protein ACI4I1_06695 [Oscillospiraceae bacterium]